ncbi:hypothetical protein GmHk_09G025002 [Glycine max]|nr:hypothetical protein GmHk_09G025002 [Glycine max]
MPNCQNFWELCNLVFPGLWSLLKQNPCMREEKLYRTKECLNVSFVQVDGTWLYRKYTGTLLIATAQDEANHIFPIAYNLRRHVTLQINISLISDRHPSIISAYNNPSNLWFQDTSHFFCLCHIAQIFFRSNSNCKHLKKPLMLAGYAYTKKMH